MKLRTVSFVLHKYITITDVFFSPSRKHKGESLVCDESVYSEEGNSSTLNIKKLSDQHKIGKNRIPVI